jgi:predicted RNA binding protein YcfA (HicA-like mRNA interferase family)
VAKKKGFVLDHSTGSHRIYRHPDGRRTTIPYHTKDIKDGTLRGIIEDIGISTKDFNDMV